MKNHAEASMNLLSSLAKELRDVFDEVAERLGKKLALSSECEI